MRSATTGQEAKYAGNGHVDLRDVVDVLAGFDDETFIKQLVHLATLPDSPYDTQEGPRILYRPGILTRVARVMQDDKELFEGTFLPALRPDKRFSIPRLLTDLKLYAAASDHLITAALSTIQREEVHWLWEPYIPFNKLTLVEGDPSVGKTYLLLTIAAAITRGYCLPDQCGKVAKPLPDHAANVLYITAEDGIADTIRPRAEDVGANLDRLFVVLGPEITQTSTQTLSLQHPHLLSEAIARHAAKLVILDPLTAFLGASMDMNRANEVRPLMSILGALATQHQCAIVAIRHWTKAPGGKARNRGQGNIDFTAAARSVLSVGESPEDERVRIMAQAKNSLGPYGISIAFTIGEQGLQWCGTSEFTADELSQMQPTKRQHQRKNAMEWLKDYLKEGPQPSEGLMEAAKAVGLSERTLKRAKEHLGILSSKEGGKWYWRLPKFEPWDRYPGQEDEDEAPF